MPKTAGKAEKLVNEIANELSRELTDKSDFLSKLCQQDDWSFVIKSHAVIEAVVTQLIVGSIGESSLLEFVERLPLADGRTGKLVVAKQLKLLGDPQLKYIRWLSELRNSIVHRYENLGFTFESHVAKLDKQGKTNWINSILWFAPDGGADGGLRKLAENDPKRAILIGVSMIVTLCIATSKNALMIEHFPNIKGLPSLLSETNDADSELSG